MNLDVKFEVYIHLFQRSREYDAQMPPHGLQSSHRSRMAVTWCMLAFLLMIAVCLRRKFIDFAVYTYTRPDLN